MLFNCCIWSHFLSLILLLSRLSLPVLSLSPLSQHDLIVIRVMSVNHASLDRIHHLGRLPNEHLLSISVEQALLLQRDLSGPQQRHVLTVLAHVLHIESG